MSRIERKLLRRRVAAASVTPTVPAREAARTRETVGRWLRPLLIVSAEIIAGWAVGIGTGLIAVAWGWL